MVLSAGATQVSGPVTGNWTVSGSPYEVIGNLNIPAGATLTIEPGVQVIFQGAYEFDIGAGSILLAQGTESDSIHFTAQNTSVHWLYIYFLMSSNSSVMEYCLIEYGGSTNTTTGYGAVTIENCNITVRHCEIRNNNAKWGGGIYCRNGASPLIEDCSIHHNTVTSTGGGIGCSMNTHPVINDCEIFNNSAANWGGGVYIYSSSSISMDGCEVYNNTATNSTNNYGGGGFYFASGTTGVITNSFIYSNTSTGTGVGGGISANNSTVRVERTVIANNTSAGIGGGIGLIRSTTSDTLHVNHCDIYGNNSANSGGGIGDVATNPFQTLVYNSIVWNNTAPSSTQYAGTFRFYYSDVAQATAGTANINADPLFVDPVTLNFQILENSPCKDTGAPDTTNNDPDGTRGDMGVFYYPQSISLDIIPDTLVFDTTGIGQSDTASFYVKNLLNETIVVDSIYSISAYFSVSSESLFVAPGDSEEVEAYFNPPGGGLATGNIVGVSRGITDTLVCRGYSEGSFYVTPNYVGFGNTLLGASQNAPVMIINPLLTELVIDSIVSNEAAFSISQSSVVVPALDSLQVFVLFSPFRNGLVSGMMTFYTEGSTASVECAGNGYGFTINPTSFNFGSAGVGATDTAYTLAVNNSFLEVTIDSVIISEPMFSWSGLANIVSAGDTAEIVMLFVPPSSGNYNATGTIYSSAGYFAVTMMGYGVGWTIDPDTLDFGFTVMGDYDTLSFYCANFENEQLIVDSMKWTDMAFQVSPTTFSVDSGETMEVPVVLHTFSSGYHGNNLYVYTNKGDVTVRMIAWVFFSGVEDKVLPGEWSFAPVTPNPFNQSLNISFTITGKEEVRLSVWNIRGEQVALLTEGEHLAGEYHYNWEADNCSSGLYFILLESDRGRFTQKAVLLK